MGEQLVGRAEACGVFDDALSELDSGRSAALALVGEPGIGKTRLLVELAARADARGQLVLYGSASELEQNLPFWVFVDALDEYVAGLEPRRLEALDDDVRTELALVLPALSRCEPARQAAFQHERYRSHRAVRELLERLTASGPLVLVLDDLHWADAGSVELLGALLRRPPAAAVLVVLAVRPRQAPQRLVTALKRADRAGALLRLEVGALTRGEARELLGEALDDAAATALYEESGGNPFYLEQLARSRAVERTAGVRELSPGDLDVPPAIAAALAEELAILSDGARGVLEGAAVAGDPFEPELAAAAAATSETSALEALDELLKLDRPLRISSGLWQSIQPSSVRRSSSASSAELRSQAAIPAGIERLRAALGEAPGGRPYAEAASELAHAGVPFGHFEEAVDTLEHAIAQLGPADRDLSLRLEAEMAIIGRLHPVTYSRTASRLERVGETIVGETPAERLILASLGTQRLLEGRPAREASALAERAWTGGLLAEQTSASPMLYDAVYVPIIAEQFGLAERICDETLADARARGSLLGIAITSCFRSHLAYRRGSIPDAETDARAGLEAAEIGGLRGRSNGARLPNRRAARKGRGRGRHAGAGGARLRRRDPGNFMANFLLFSRGRLRIAAAQTESGVADLRELGLREEHSRARNPSALPYRSQLALALAQLDGTAEPRSLVAEELALARKCETPRAIGMTLRALGLIDGSQTGIDRLRESVAVLERSGAPLEEARALTDLGAALRRSGERRLARGPLRRALDLASRCGASALAERAKAELLATGARPRRVVLSGTDALTPSERRVAQLAAEGLSNRRIAQSLFVSMSTVAVHLTHAYQKLGISTREELAQALAPAHTVQVAE